MKDTECKETKRRSRERLMRLLFLLLPSVSKKSKWRRKQSSREGDKEWSERTEELAKESQSWMALPVVFLSAIPF